MQMTDRDQDMVKELQKRIFDQSQALSAKHKLFEAIQKNFAILKGMSDHQKKEHNLLSRQNVKMKAQYEKNAKELKELKEAHVIVMEELTYLREKDVAFNNADLDRQQMLEKVAALEREVER